MPLILRRLLWSLLKWLCELSRYFFNLLQWLHLRLELRCARPRVFLKSVNFYMRPMPPALYRMWNSLEFALFWMQPRHCLYFCRNWILCDILSSRLLWQHKSRMCEMPWFLWHLLWLGCQFLFIVRYWFISLWRLLHSCLPWWLLLELNTKYLWAL